MNSQVLKEKQKKLRESSQLHSAAFMSYEQWLRNLNLPEEAEKWRHRKNKRILLLTNPNDTTVSKSFEYQEYTGLSDFSMTVTKQGVKFASKGKPEAMAFMDVGQVIKVYDQGDSSILAALQLAQSKWGGVQVNGTDRYKRKCAELAARHGIKVTNPELQDIIKQATKEFQEQKSQNIPLPSPKEAIEIIKTEARKQRELHIKLYNAYHEHKKALQVLIEAEPEKPLLLGIEKWRREYARWNIEKDALSKTFVEDLTALGCVMDKPERMEAEVERQHKTYKERALQKAAALHPEAAEAIRMDAARKKKEESEAKEAKEALERQERESRDALYEESSRVMRQAGKTFKWAFVYDASPDGRKYTREILGIIPWEGEHVAVQKISDEMAVLHRFKIVPEELTVGSRWIIAHEEYNKVTLIPERERERAEYRGR